MGKKKEVFLDDSGFDKERLQKFFNEFQLESPRACAILTCAYLDNLLNELLRRRLVEDKELFKKIDGMTFEQRIDLCYLSGSLSKEEKEDLHLLRKIRNDFAHDININNFKKSDIRAKCEKLWIPKFLGKRAPGFIGIDLITRRAEVHGLARG